MPRKRITVFDDDMGWSFRFDCGVIELSSDNNYDSAEDAMANADDFAKLLKEPVEIRR